ncbi:MAG: discoidin domain-containing protein, partial [Bacteroidales bacterium]
MDKKHTLTGFRMVPCYSMWGPGYAVAKMQVYTSEDGENWTSQGDISLHRPAAGSSAANPDFHYVRFYFPVEATHFRFQIKETHTESFGAINEVEAYE